MLRRLLYFHRLSTFITVNAKLSFTMATRRSSRITALKEKPTNNSPSISSHFRASKPATKRKSEKITGSIREESSVDTKDGFLNGTSSPAPSDEAQQQPKTKQRTIRRPALVAANTAPRQVKQLAHTTHPFETLADIPTPPPDRLADPYQTNAPLIVPESSELVARTPVPDVLPFKDESAELKEVLTTENMLEKALKHLVKVEPKLKPIVEKHHCNIFSVEGLNEVIDPWASLTSSIIGQQVSGAAAKSIKNKFVALFNPSATDNSQHVFPTPSKVAETSLEVLRTAGLSQRKAEYIQGLAQKFASGDLTTEFLMKAPYEEVFEKLVAVRGLGAWSVEMFACFGLKRLDVFSTGDLGVQRGMAALMGRDVNKLKNGGKGKWKYMGEKEMLEVSEKFRPYRSVFMWYMWRVEDVDVDVMEKA